MILSSIHKSRYHVNNYKMLHTPAKSPFQKNPRLCIIFHSNQYTILVFYFLEELRVSTTYINRISRGLFLGAIVLVIAIAVIAYQPHTNAADSDTMGIPQQTILAPHAQLGMIRLNSTDEQSYLSPIIKSDAPFTHLVLRSEVVGPISMPTPSSDAYGLVEHTNGVENEVRVSTDGKAWSEWTVLPVDNDLWLPEDGPEVSWSAITYVGDGMHYWQIRATSQTAQSIPDIKHIEVNTVDARFGDKFPQATADFSSLSNGETANIEKPPVVSRTAWGCPDGVASRAQPDYRYATHLVIHHTAGSNSFRVGEESWADRVRAIWSFHTITRGWGDIGYNYIISPDGTIYEGRAGGDNAVGFHDTANYGSMGISLIGTYESVDPSPEAQDSLVALLGWKANRNDIDPLGKAYYYGCSISAYCQPYTPSGVLNTITGHRYVTPNYTSCPGQRVVDLMPSIRERVKQYMVGGGSLELPDNGDLLIDELESSFTRSEANWYRAPCGDSDHTFYTYATDTKEESTNWATWQPTISISGTYRVYAHIPQGCGLASPPYASEKAAYQIHSAEGVTEKIVDHNTAETWVELGTFQFVEGGESFVTLSDLTSESYADRRVIFFDSIKWVEEGEVPPEPDKVELLDVAYDRKTLPIGELLQVVFTVKNGTEETLETQYPQADTFADGSFDSNGGYVYNEYECMLGDEGETYPTYPKEPGRFRVTLGPTDRKVECIREHGGYPWRWGFNEPLPPGETRTITGYIRFSQPGEVTLQAGLIEEYVTYHAQEVAPTTITITEEQQAPVLTRFDANFAPLAQVYQLAPHIPDNFLIRMATPFSVLRGEYIGSFGWDGSFQDWEDGVPLPVNDHVLIEQTRVFTVPVTGEYTFQTISNGNAWLWIDGQTLLLNHGLSAPPDITDNMSTTVQLQAGAHVLSFKYYQISVSPKMGYSIQHPEDTTFHPITDGLSDVLPSAQQTFTTTPKLRFAADDQSGSGIAEIRYSWDGDTWESVTFAADDNTTPRIMSVVPLSSTTYLLHYQAIDRQDNSSGVEQLAFVVDALPDEPTPTPAPTLVPTLQPTAEITPTLAPTTEITPTLVPTTEITPTLVPTIAPTTEMPTNNIKLFLPIVRR